MNELSRDAAHRKLRREVEDARAACLVDPIPEHLELFETDVLPLRVAADEGRGTYEEYDEAYNVWLEELHDYVKDRYARFK